MIKPYYSDDAVTIYHGDCREILPQIPAKSVDLVLTDPPFGVRDDRWDIFSDVEAFRNFTASWLVPSYATTWVLACFFADKYIPLLLAVAEANSIPYRRALVWRKPAGSQFAGASLDGFWYDFELIQVFGVPTFCQPKATRFGVLEYRTVINQEHGCQKPLVLLQELVEAYSSDGGIILDPFLGTGTTAFASKKLNRKCIGIEIEEKSCEIAANRCRQMVFNLKCITPSKSGAL